MAMTPSPIPQPGINAANQVLLAATTQSNVSSYSLSNIPIKSLITTGAKAGDVLYVDRAGDAVWGDPLVMEEERFLNDPFLKDSYEKYRTAKAELTMRIKLQKDAENGK